jgi:excisionase family DNA binding protein
VRDPRQDRAAAQAPQLWEISGPPDDSQPTRQPRPRLRPVPVEVETESPPPAGPEPRRPVDRREGRQADLVLLLSVEEVARALGIGRSKTYELIAAGELEAVHIGRAARVPVAAVEDFVERLRRCSD